MEESLDTLEALRGQIAAIERDLEAGSYRPGPWSRLTKQVRAMPVDSRCLVAEDLSRISRKLHLRGERRTLSVRAGYIAEAIFALLGAVILAFGAGNRSNVLVILAALIWTTAFQPLIKIGTGHLLGIGYEYAYLYGIEPRFKMRFGQYLSKPRYVRLLLHLSGMIGSPIGACLPILFIAPTMRVAIYFCWALFWIVVAINVGAFVAALAAIGDRVGSVRLTDSSGGLAALELREALEI